VGKRIVDLPAAEFAELRDRHAGVLLDAGTGDGRHVMRLARQRPDWLVVGLDASADGMRKASTRAAAKPARGGLPNALFVRSSVEQLPPGLADVSEVHVIMPWGSLLRGMAGGEPGVLSRLAGACVPGAKFLVTLNLHAWRPSVPEVGSTPEPDPDRAMDELAKAYAGSGWRIEQAAYLGDEEIEQLATSWTRRLGSSRERFDVLALTGTIRPE
jgi:16S rRNA (adenine(1408)-N(1))-methyltransferase